MHAEVELPRHHHEWIRVGELPQQLVDGTAMNDWLVWRPMALAMASQVALLFTKFQVSHMLS